MQTKGLYYLIREKKAEMASADRAARKPSMDPRIAHDHGVASDGLRREIAQMSELATENEALADNINQLLHYAASSKHKTRYRSLVITALEQAICWLQRENGDADFKTHQ